MTNVAAPRRENLALLYQGLLTGIVTLTDLRKARQAGLPDETPLSTFCTRHLITVTPEMPLSDALRRMSTHDLGRLPVTDNPNPPYKALGLLRRRDVISAYEILEQRQQELAELRRQIEAG